MIQTKQTHKKIIFSDSKSAMESLKSKDWMNPLLLKILGSHHYLCTVCHKVIYCLTPSHIGIQGNELADHAAKDGLDKRITDIPVPFTSYIHSGGETAQWLASVHQTGRPGSNPA